MKFGRKPAVHTRRSFRSGLVIAYHLNQLGAPPDEADWTPAVDKATGGDWGVLGNDQYGCCVEADEAHALMLRTANTGTIVRPTEQDVLALYTAETGFDPKRPETDQGTDELSACQWMETTGFLGHRASAIGAVDPLNFDHLRWCIQLFGYARTGFAVPDYAEDQFNRGQPWDVEAPGPSGPNIVGGHDVPFVKYDQELFYCVTWGKLQAVTRAFVEQFFEEAHALLFDDWIKQGGLAPSDLDQRALLEDLHEVSS